MKDGDNCSPALDSKRERGVFDLAKKIEAARRRRAYMREARAEGPALLADPEALEAAAVSDLVRLEGIARWYEDRLSTANIQADRERLAGKLADLIDRKMTRYRAIYEARVETGKQRERGAAGAIQEFMSRLRSGEFEQEPGSEMEAAPVKRPPALDPAIAVIREQETQRKRDGISRAADLWRRGMSLDGSDPFDD
jgi:hypothetical protein